MATALNAFKTITSNVTTSLETVYTAPAGYTGIVLMAQISNVSENTSNVTFIINNGTGDFELLKQFDIPKNDAISGTVGKLVIETGSSVKISSSANNELKLILSVLESANE
jgi:cell shape-determining protein MreC